MRVALMILLGLVIGIIGTVNVMSTLAARNPMPKAVMATMDYHMNELSHALKAKQCDAASIQHHLERVQSTANRHRADVWRCGAAVYGCGPPAANPRFSRHCNHRPLTARHWRQR